MRKRLLALTAVWLLSPVAIFAGPPAPSTAQTNLCNGAGGSVQTNCSSADALKAPFTTQIGNIVNVLLYLAGAVAVIVLIAGGIMYVTSTGDSKRIQQAKDTIIYAVTGLVVAILAYAIVNFVIARI